MLIHPQFDPVALALGPVQIHWYGLTYLAAFGLFYWLATRRILQPVYAARGWTPFAFQRQVWRALAARQSGLLHATTGPPDLSALGALLGLG